jgi:MFS transporter, MHS family, proline/betaine transporter
VAGSVNKFPIVVGTTLEWFDLTVYAFFASTISVQFFPPGNDQAAVLATAAAFGLAFLMRPVGALAFGRIGDRLGRKTALMLSFTLMAIATAMIALAPTFAQAGMLAPAILVTGRLLQGFAASGEVGASVAMLLETSDSRHQGVAAGWLNLGVYSALVLGSLSSLAVYALLSPSEVQSWGWRLPFLFGLLVAPVGLYVRWYMGESPQFLAARMQQAPSSASDFRDNALNVLKLVGLGGFGSSVIYLVLIFMPSYATRELHLPEQIPRLSTFVASAILVALLVPMGRVSDRVGAWLVMIVSCAVGTALVLPLMLHLIASPSLGALLAVQCSLSVCLAAYVTACGPVAIRLFPVRQRALGIGLGYNLGAVTFGAFAPFFTAWLAVATGIKSVIAWYVLGGGLIALLASLSLRRAGRFPLPAAARVPLESLDRTA